MIRTVHLPEEVRAACDDARRRGTRVGFVPTMGALHDGHLALVRAAKARAPFVGVSIFVNPTQFGPNEDFSKYPRDLAGDVAKLEGVGADFVFAPDDKAMYPAGEETRVHVGRLAESLCGPLRPGHFEGVATVVTKLFAIVGAHVAMFGKKDYQQLAILRRVARDLFLPVEIVGHPIVREADGVAMSSRNAYLSPDERQKARGLSRGLSAAALAFASGERAAGVLERLARAEIEPLARIVEYVAVVDADTLVPIERTAPDRALLAVAARIGATRLIDNVVLGEDPAPVPR
jgi:pantoate--beta-alanine ligase